MVVDSFKQRIGIGLTDFGEEIELGAKGKNVIITITDPDTSEITTLDLQTYISNNPPISWRKV